MTRNTIIIGNGLGMALDPHFFALDTAIDNTWNSGCLSTAQQQQIQACISAHGVNDRPHGEDHLDILQVAVVACQFLNQISTPNVTWLTNDGQIFPEAIGKFITSTAWHFHHYQGAIPASFFDSLAAYLRNTESHIATLNYDNILYQSLIDRNILDGYNGHLVDGFYMSTGFNANNLKRRQNRTFGYYLHLHGSPLFINNGNMPVKQSQATKNEDIPSPHIVLTHVQHKKSVIASSNLLSTYWQFLELGLQESDKIIVFGYSGYDTHLNQVISDNLPITTAEGVMQKEVIVIEWSGAGTTANREYFWKNKFNASSIQLIQLPNILDFQGWDNL